MANRRPLADGIAHAESEAARHLGTSTSTKRPGDPKAAESSLAAAQRWLDRANDLCGWVTPSEPVRSTKLDADHGFCHDPSRAHAT